MYHTIIFIIIVIAFILPFNTKTKAKFYLIEDYGKFGGNSTDTSDTKSVNETIKTPKMSYKSKKSGDRDKPEDYQMDDEPQASDVLSDEAQSFMDEIEQKSPGYKLVEGDMILDPNQQKTFEDISEDYMDEINQALVGSQWPNNKMFYTFDGTVDEGFKGTIRNAVSELAEKLKGCIEIVEGDNENCVIVSAKNNRQCVAMVGVNKHMKNTLQLDPNKCNRQGTIQHEFIHALGIFHHQSRKDRDKYLKINWNNIITAPKDMTHNFRKQQHSATYNLPYDYQSIMHYGGTFFSKNGAPTIETRNPDNQKKIGGRKTITNGDVTLIKTFYGCTGGTKNTPDTVDGSDITGGSQEIDVSDTTGGSEVLEEENDTTPLNTILAASQGNGDVSCGGHRAEDCSKCGSGSGACNGDCNLINGNTCVTKNGGNGGNNVPPQISEPAASPSNGDVSCGGHRAEDCSKCGSGPDACNGDCNLINGNTCVTKNGGNGGNNVPPQTSEPAAAPNNRDVSCGGHRAEDCSQCGSDSGSCNGDCHLINGNSCVAKN